MGINTSSWLIFIFDESFSYFTPKKELNIIAVCLTIKTITKVLDALGMSASVILQNTQAIDKNVIVYIVAVINEFAKTYHISVREANNYLIRFNGIDFLTEHYEAEHLLSLDDAIQDLTQVCLNNGGGIQ